MNGAVEVNSVTLHDVLVEPAKNRLSKNCAASYMVNVAATVLPVVAVLGTVHDVV